MTNSEIKKIENKKGVTHCYIKKGSYYRPDACGYTDYITKAGVYEKSEAIKHAMGCRDIRLIPVDINKHNALIIEEVKDLLSRFIK